MLHVNRTCIDQVLPSLVLPALSALAAFIVLGHIHNSGLGNKMPENYCSSPTASPYSLSYTNIPTVDQHLCVIVASFHALFEPSNLPFNVDLIAEVAVIAAIPAIEAARHQRHALLAGHVAVMILLICHIFSAAAVMPCYWWIFIVTGAASLSRGPSAKIDQAHAEAVLFGIVVGYIIPSIAMLVMENPNITAIWPGFPLWMLIAQHAHLLFRPSSRYPESGYRTVQATYIFLFLFSAIPHIYFTSATIIAGDYARFQSLYVPSLAIPDASLSVSAAMLDVMQWDLIFVFASAILASLWTAKSTTHFFRMILWFGAAGLAFGPGAAIAGAFAWREGVLNGTDGGMTEKKEN